MAAIPLYHQGQLASSRTGVPPIDESGQITAQHIISNTAALSNAELSAQGTMISQQANAEHQAVGEFVQGAQALSNQIQHVRYQNAVAQKQAQREAQIAATKLKTAQDAVQAAIDASAIKQGLSDLAAQTQQQPAYKVNPDQAPQAFNDMANLWIKDFNTNNPADNPEIANKRTIAFSQQLADNHDALTKGAATQRNTNLAAGLETQLDSLAKKGANGFTPEVMQGIKDLEAPLTERFGPDVAKKKVADTLALAAKNSVYNTISAAGASTTAAEADTAIKTLNETKKMLQGRVYTDVLEPHEREGLLQNISTQLKAQDEVKARGEKAIDIHNDLSIEDTYHTSKTGDPQTLAAGIITLNTARDALKVAAPPAGASAADIKRFDATKLANEKDLDSKIQSLKAEQDHQARLAKQDAHELEMDAKARVTDAQGQAKDEMYRMHKEYQDKKDKAIVEYTGPEHAALRNTVNTAIANLTVTKNIHGTNDDLQKAFAAGVALSRASKAGAMVNPLTGNTSDFNNKKKLIAEYLQRVISGGTGTQYSKDHPFVPGAAQESAKEYLKAINKLPSPEFHKLLNPLDSPTLRDELTRKFLDDKANGKTHWENKLQRLLTPPEIDNIGKQAERTAISQAALQGKIPPAAQKKDALDAWAPAPHETRATYADRLAKAVNTKSMSVDDARKAIKHYGVGLH